MSAFDLSLLPRSATVNAAGRCHVAGVALDEARTTATLVLLVVGLWVLNILARPITPFRGMLFGSMVACFVAVLAIEPLREFYALDLPEREALVEGLIVAAVACALLEIAWMVAQRRQPAPDRTRRLALRNPAAVRGGDP